MTVFGDATTAVVEMAVHGEWSPHFGDRFSAGLRLCLAGPSISIIINLHHLDDPSGSSLPFWLSAWREARLATPPVGLVFCLSSTSTLGRRLCRAGRQRPRVFATAAEARIAAQTFPADRLQARLPPRPDRVRDVRELAENACHAWSLSHLLHDTSLVACELASNAIKHAGTDFVVTLSRTANRLLVAVQDGSVGLPRPHQTVFAGSLASGPEQGRGLLVVHATATAWGAMPTRGGKVVWATLT